jgi:hypothetical protein
MTTPSLNAFKASCAPSLNPSLHDCRLPHASGGKDGALRPRGQPKGLRKSPPRPAILAWLVWPLFVGRGSQRFPTPPGVHPLEGDPALVADKSYIKGAHHEQG